MAFKERVVKQDGILQSLVIYNEPITVNRYNLYLEHGEEQVDKWIDFTLREYLYHVGTATNNFKMLAKADRLLFVESECTPRGGSLVISNPLLNLYSWEREDAEVIDEDDLFPCSDDATIP